jgi:ectoine hydroxylase-related dioxygenase (phytanoyl-CoA dioxygenase family)
MNRLEAEGWTVIPAGLRHNLLRSLRDSAFSPDEAGHRCLLDLPTVKEAALLLRTVLINSGFLPKNAIAIQAIAFDKTQNLNWKVTWHQDLVFPFARSVTTPTFEVPSIKDGVAYARPPRDVLEELLAVRLHLDDCDETSGPLRVAPGTHREGIFKAAEVARVLERSAQTTCCAREGEALLMKPLLLHASSQATTPKHRRVLHLVYHTGSVIPEDWHRAV